MYIIIGLGITGLACARFLNHLKIPFTLMDTRKDPPNLNSFKQDYPPIPIFLGPLNEKILLTAEIIIVSPGISCTEVALVKAKQQGIPIIGDIELFARYLKKNQQVIAITGTNAKSTVTTLLGLMAKANNVSYAVGGNLGTPALELLLNYPHAQLFILEVSSFQLETTLHLHPQVATVLNITPDHLDRYPNFKAYQNAKLRIYQGCKKAVCNRDDDLTFCPIKPPLGVTYFTHHAPQGHEFGLIKNGAQDYLAYDTTLLMTTQELAMAGKHAAFNALAALAIGHAYGFNMQLMLTVLKEFKGLPHRCELIREMAGVKWINDSKGTNVGATLAAVEGIGSEILGKLIVIAGGARKKS